MILEYRFQFSRICIPYVHSAVSSANRDQSPAWAKRSSRPVAAHLKGLMTENVIFTFAISWEILTSFNNYIISNSCTISDCLFLIQYNIGKLTKVAITLNYYALCTYLNDRTIVFILRSINCIVSSRTQASKKLLSETIVHI